MNLCQYCWLYKTSTSVHPLEDKIICNSCRLGEIKHRTKQLEDWITGCKKPVPSSFARQLQGLDQIEGHLQNKDKLKSLTYEALKARLRTDDRYDGQGSMI